MTSGRVECRLAALAVLSILTIFLFPGVQGPYSVVHGPATALLAARAALRLRVAIIHAALRSSAGRLIPSLTAPLMVLSRSILNNESSSLRPSESSAILRC